MILEVLDVARATQVMVQDGFPSLFSIINRADRNYAGVDSRIRGAIIRRWGELTQDLVRALPHCKGLVAELRTLLESGAPLHRFDRAARRLTQFVRGSTLVPSSIVEELGPALDQMRDLVVLPTRTDV